VTHSGVEIDRIKLLYIRSISGPGDQREFSRAICFRDLRAIVRGSFSFLEIYRRLLDFRSGKGCASLCSSRPAQDLKTPTMSSISTCFGSGLRLAAAQTIKPRSRSCLVKTSDRLLRSLSTQATRRAAFGRTGLNARASSSTLTSTRSISFTPHSKSSATLSQVPPAAFNQEENYHRSDSKTDSLPILTTPAVAKWLYLSSGLVFFIVVVGGVTRLTESGLSITEWEPVKGILPPIGEDQWMVEWEKYRVTPEGVL
jgi:hypothetical protein